MLYEVITASEAMVLQLDAHLAHVGQLIEYQLGMNVANVPGTGAAGGLGAGLMAFTNARLQPGFEIVITSYSIHYTKLYESGATP